ncbi:MAG: hypothetical protein QM703_13560 [Gemmatales bacterium]
MRLLFAGMIVVGVSILLWITYYGYSQILRMRGKSPDEIELELKRLGIVAMFSLIGGIALMVFANMFMSKEERTQLDDPPLPNARAFRPPPPISISWRGSKIGASKVLQIRNNNNGPLENIVVQVRNPKKFVQDEYTIELLNPGEMAELGWTKWKWNMELGDVIRILVPGFSEATYTYE